MVRKVNRREHKRRTKAGSTSVKKHSMTTKGKSGRASPWALRQAELERIATREENPYYHMADRMEEERRKSGRSESKYGVLTEGGVVVGKVSGVDIEKHKSGWFSALGKDGYVKSDTIGGVKRLLKSGRGCSARNYSRRKLGGT